MRCSKRHSTLLGRSFHHPLLFAVGKTHSFCQFLQMPKEKSPKSMMPIAVRYSTILIAFFRTFDNVELASFFQVVLKWALSQLRLSAALPQEWFRLKPLTLWWDRETYQARAKVYSEAEAAEEARREGEARGNWEAAQDCQENGQCSREKYAEENCGSGESWIQREWR